MSEMRAGLLIKQIHSALEKEANKNLAAEDLTLSQLGLLMELQQTDQGMLSYKALEKRLGLAQSTTVGLISRLEKKEMVVVQTDSADGRIKYARLTDEGKRCCQRAEASMKEHEELMLADFTPPERVAFLDYLDRVKKALKR